MKTIALKMSAFCAAAMLLTATTASADVQLTMQNGHVTLVAKDATVRQILTEWARVGHTKIVNVERIPGGPITLELNDVAEAQALDILLRSISGYIAAPRPAEAVAANLSQFDRIIVMPTLANARPAATTAAPAPVFQPTPPYNPQQHAVDDDTDDDQPQPNVPMPPNRGPVFNTFPQQQPQPMPINPQTGQPMSAPQPTAYPGQPTAPFGGVAVPGMVAPAPQQQPGQVQPGTAEPVRRPRGPEGPEGR